MKPNLFFFICALAFSFSSQAARIYYVQNTNDLMGKFVYGLESVSSKTVWVYRDGEDRIKTTLGSDGIYHSTNSRKPIHIKVSSDLSFSSYMNDNSESGWIDGYRLEKLEDQCLVVEGNTICKHVEGTYPGGVATFMNFYRDVRGEEYSSQYSDEDYPYVVGRLNKYKDFAPLRNQDSSIRCVAKTVCIGDKVYFKASDFLGLFQEGKIKAFSVHGIVTEDYQLYTYALNHDQYKVFKKTYAKDCSDLTPNEIRKYQSELAIERCTTLKDQGLAAMCTYTGVQTPWGSFQDYERGEEKNTCVVEGTIYPWVKSPLIREEI